LRDDFGPFDGESWINCAMQGPLPRVAIRALNEAVSLKIKPSTLDDSMFYSVPRKLKDALGRLLNVSPEEIVIGNSASYGLHLLANGIPWERGDEVLLVEGDFAADIMPWQGLQSEGVKTRFVRSSNHMPDAEELERSITEDTRVFCTTWVHSYTGHSIDLEGVSDVCREMGVKLVLNGSQAIGYKALDLSRMKVDAVTSGGYKWLCGPYGTGFCWIEPGFLERLDYNQAYWLAMQGEGGLDEAKTGIVENLGAMKYDVFGTASFHNVMPWTASVEYLLSKGLPSIGRHDQELMGLMIEGIDTERYEIISPAESKESSIFVIEHRRGNTREIYNRVISNGFHVSLRYDRIRISPHLYNTVDEVLSLVELLNKFS
jgi:cysteine desulfurase/selenocysteine lyase